MVQKILILASNPRGDLKSVNREVDDLVSSLERLENFKIISRVAPRPEQLRSLFAERPQIVHFCGHGTGEQGLVLQDEDGREQLVSTELLVSLFKIFPDDITCTVLNACDSEYQAKAIVEHIHYVIGMKRPILDASAHIFAVGFYDAFAKGLSVEQAYQVGCWAIQEQEIKSKGNSQSIQSSSDRKAEIVGQVEQPKQPHLAEHMTPVLLSNKLLPSSSTEIDFVPQELVEFTHKEIDRKEYKDAVRAAYDNFGQFSAQNRVFPSESEATQRKVLLKKVKKFWIEGFLQPSLQGVDALNLDLKARPGAIADLSQGIEALSVELDASYERLRETQIYEEIGQGRTLLILGTPGSGKTIALLQLTQRLIERSERDSSLPLPVVFNLSSWAKDRKSIVNWLIDELREKYQVPRSLSEAWIKQQQLILLLDGLDEVKQDYRNDCVRALNQFIGLFPKTEIAVCSRVKDYEALTDRLQISSSLCLQPLSPEQVYQFLDSAGGALAGLKMLLKRDLELEQFAQTPLVLNFMSVAYQGWSVADLIPPLRANPNRAQHLFDTYIDRRLEQGAASEYSKDKVLRWLSWLASRMARESRTVFLIEKMQPAWFQTKTQIVLYQIGNVLTYVLSIWIIIGVFYGFMGYGKIYGLSVGLGVGLISGLDKEIKIVETLKFSFREIRRSLISRYTIIVGLIGALVATLIYSLSGPQEFSVYRLIDGLIYGLSIGLSVGLVNGLRGLDIDKKTIANQGIWRSVWKAGFFALIGGLIVGLIYGPIIQPLYNYSGLDYWLYFLYGVLSGGLMVGLVSNAGKACIQHFILRLILHRKNYIPWNCTRFLDFASDRLLTKKIGGGYVFFHRMLLEHFAQISRSKTPIPVITEPTPLSIAKKNPRINIRSSNANTIENTAPQFSNSVHNCIVCSNCSHPNPTNGKFCHKCGKQLIKPL